MDLDTARTALLAQRDDLQRLLRGEQAAVAEDVPAGSTHHDPGDIADTAQPLEARSVDEAVAAGLQERLEAVERALQRIEDGTYGRSVRSGEVIPDERLEADPSAELTVEEAAELER